MRSTQTQPWPACQLPPHTTADAAASRSASSAITVASLPPSSSSTGVRFSRARSHDSAAGRHRSGERDLVDARRAQRRAGLTEAGDPADQSVRRIGIRLVERLHGVHAGGRAELGRFDDRGIPGRQRVRESAEHRVDREVPGRDHPDDAERQVLQPRVEVHHGDTRRHAPLFEHAFGVPGRPAQVLERRDQLELGVTLRLAGLAEPQLADLVRVLGDPGDPLLDALLAAGEAESGPPGLRRRAPSPPRRRRPRRCEPGTSRPPRR